MQSFHYSFLMKLIFNSKLLLISFLKWCHNNFFQFEFFSAFGVWTLTCGVILFVKSFYIFIFLEMHYWYNICIIINVFLETLCIKEGREEFYSFQLHHFFISKLGSLSQTCDVFHRQKTFVLWLCFFCPFACGELTRTFCYLKRCDQT